MESVTLTMVQRGLRRHLLPNAVVLPPWKMGHAGVLVVERPDRSMRPSRPVAWAARPALSYR